MSKVITRTHILDDAIHAAACGSPRSTTTTLFRESKKRRFDNDSLDLIKESEAKRVNNSINKKWAQHALLFSSFTDGVQYNKEALQYLRQGVTRKMSEEFTRYLEKIVKQSAVVSPCVGPTNLDALAMLEQCDALIEDYDRLEFCQHRQDIVDQLMELMISASGDHEDSFNRCVKLLYIPTAMYALRKDSTNTPGKQRQRARVDAKQRRDLIVATLDSVFDGSDILAVSLDLDDGSVKQPTSTLMGGAVTDNEKLRTFPREGKEALVSWSPHIVYVEGGNTFWLSHCMNLGDWGHYIRSACTNGYNGASAVYCGKSAGAIVGGSFVETATWKGWDDPSVVPGMEKPEDWKGIKGMSLLGDTNISFFPHMSPTWKNLVDERRSTIQGKAFTLEENQVVLVDGKRQRYNVCCQSVSQLADKA